MEIQFEQTRADVFAFNRHVYLRRRISWIIIGVYPLFAAYLMRRSEPGQVFAVALGTLVILAAFIFGLQFLIIKIRLSSKRYAAFMGPRTYRIDDSGIEAVTPDSTSKLGWKMIQKVAITPHHAFLHLTPLNALILPRRAFPSDEAFQQTIDEIRRHLASAAAAA